MRAAVVLLVIKGKEKKIRLSTNYVMQHNLRFVR